MHSELLAIEVCRAGRREQCSLCFPTVQLYKKENNLTSAFDTHPNTRHSLHSTSTRVVYRQHIRVLNEVRIGLWLVRLCGIEPKKCRSAKRLQPPDPPAQQLLQETYKPYSIIRLQARYSPKLSGVHDQAREILTLVIELNTVR